jgi:thymidylate kinase
MPQRIIIYEGPDRCGKTEQAKELSRRLGIPYFKNAAEHEYFLSDPSYFLNAIRYVDTYFTSYLESSESSVILDRAWPSEWIYSQALGRQTDFELLRKLDERHASLGTVIVIPHRSSYAGVKDEYDNINDNITRIHDLYMQFAKWTKCKTVLVNVDDEDLEREMRETMQGLVKAWV